MIHKSNSIRIIEKDAFCEVTTGITIVYPLIHLNGGGAVNHLGYSKGGLQWHRIGGM